MIVIVLRTDQSAGPNPRRFCSTWWGPRSVDLFDGKEAAGRGQIDGAIRLKTRNTPASRPVGTAPLQAFIPAVIRIVVVAYEILARFRQLSPGAQEWTMWTGEWPCCRCGSISTRRWD
jgi:hypothetical protein